MGVFQDLQYPDNNNRANRATELTTDIKTAIYELHSDKVEIDRLLARAETAMKKAYGGKVSLPAAFNAATISSSSAAGDWVAYVSDLILPILAAKTISGYLDKAFVSMLVESGRIGEGAFASLVGLPTWMKWGSRAGGAAAAAIAFVAVDAVISAITGAIQRDALRQMIKDTHAKRVEFTEAKLKVAQVKTTLSAVEAAYDGIAHVVTDPAQLDQIARALVTQHELDLDQIDTAFVEAHLAALDKARGSWTAEDTL